MSEVIEEPSTIEKLVIPDGLPKSGKVWKQKQVYRSSSQNRKGVLSNLATTFEVKQVQREKIKALKGLEREMKEETQRKKDDAKKRREEQQKRRMANELKTAVYQEVLIGFVNLCFAF